MLERSSTGHYNLSQRLIEFRINILNTFQILQEFMRYALSIAQIFIGFFCFFDKGNLIILTNGFQKKTQKTPKGELELAEKLKKQYFDEKNGK